MQKLRLDGAGSDYRWNMCQEAKTTADPTRVGATLAALYPPFMLLWWDVP